MIIMGEKKENKSQMKENLSVAQTIRSLQRELLYSNVKTNVLTGTHLAHMFKRLRLFFHPSNFSITVFCLVLVGLSCQQFIFYYFMLKKKKKRQM